MRRPDASRAPEPGFDARRRLAQLEALAELQTRLLRQAADRLDALERRAPDTEPARPRYLALAEAAARSGLSTRSLKRLIERGAVGGRALRVTGSRRRWLVDAEALAAFLSTPAAPDGIRPGLAG